MGLTFEGDGDLDLTGAADLESATPTELAFVGAKKFFKTAESSSAGCLIATSDFPTSGRTLIRAAEARGTFAAALQILYPQRSTNRGVHPTAVVEQGAILGEGVSIGAHCYVGEGSIIGSRSILHPR
ncbi:MAG: hypothetical protein K2X36_06775, partial [Microbacteriaceae bacterium]|nr:hypothetical protein [Microbacteriaceae bacterium]